MEEQSMRKTFVHRCVSWCPPAVLVLAACCVAIAGADSRPAEKFTGLGSHGRKISTRSPEAQEYFNQGLAFLYAFNHDEALRQFGRAAELDPDCAAVQWAIALTNGPHINNPVVDEAHARAAWKALSRARELAPQASPVEKALIDALGNRYANPQPEDRMPLDEAYAAAMRKVWEQYPGDADIGALFAESMMDLRPWDLWTHDGKPQPGTDEVLKTLETVIERSPRHPLALHLYIHAVEASPHPEKAAVAADRLRDLQPALGHMVHMPSHIDVRLGHWQRAVDANEKAIVADSAYRQRVPEQGFFRFYMAHNHHMLAFAAMMQGREKRSTLAIRQMIDEIPADWLKENAALADGISSMPYEMHLRFGRWDAMLAEPEPPDYLPIARTLRHFARGVAFAAKDQVSEAKNEQREFLAARAKVPEDAVFVLNTAAAVFDIAEKMLEGEILYREGKVDEGVAALREAVRREETLRYTEPPDWIQPVRHALGATLIDAGRFADAEQVYREDLARHPENGWSLFGLSRALRLQGRDDEAAPIAAKFEKAWQHADVKLSSSCYCLPGRK